MAVSGFPEGVLVKWGCIIECHFIEGKSIEPLVDILGNGSLDTRGMVTLCIDVKWSVVLLPKGAMLTLKQVESHI